MGDLVFWAVVLLVVLLFGRWVLAILQRFLPLVLLAAVLVLVLSQCQGEVRQLFDNV